MHLQSMVADSVSVSSCKRGVFPSHHHRVVVHRGSSDLFLLFWSNIMGHSSYRVLTIYSSYAECQIR